MDGVPTQTAGTSEILASDWNTYVRDNFDSIKFGHVTVADNTAKSALSVAEGTMVYQLDNQKVFVYSGSAWVEVADLDRTGALPETSPGHLIVADNTAKTALTASEGMMVYQSDNNKVFVYDGSSWVEVNDLDNPGAWSDAAPRGIYGGGVRRIMANNNGFTNNTTYADFPNATDKAAMDLTFVKEVSGTALFVQMQGSVSLDSGVAQNMFLGISIGGSDYDVAQYYFPTTGRLLIVGSNVLTGISASSLAVKPRFKTGAASASTFAANVDFVSYTIIEVRV
jgi:hypothetical protein